MLGPFQKWRPDLKVQIHHDFSEVVVAAAAVAGSISYRLGIPCMIVCLSLEYIGDINNKSLITYNNLYIEMFPRDVIVQ